MHCGASLNKDTANPKMPKTSPWMPANCGDTENPAQEEDETPNESLIKRLDRWLVRSFFGTLIIIFMYAIFAPQVNALWTDISRVFTGEYWYNHFVEFTSTFGVEERDDVRDDVRKPDKQAPAVSQDLYRDQNYNIFKDNRIEFKEETVVQVVFGTPEESSKSEMLQRSIEYLDKKIPKPNETWVLFFVHQDPGNTPFHDIERIGDYQGKLLYL